jgi:hypothetical protein
MALSLLGLLMTLGLARDEGTPQEAAEATAAR